MAKKSSSEAQENAEVPASLAVTKKPASPKKIEKPVSVNIEIPEKILKKDKPRKIKMIRDSFSLPENDYAKLTELKKRCLQAGVQVKKSELIRAGLLSLSRLTDAALIKLFQQVKVIKTGRPAKE
ncbi:MAG: hypothetical protein ACWA6R_08140 [Nitrosomonas sp.]